MASEEENQGQHIVECDLCETPVSFYCRRCGVNLCDSCLPIHMRVKSKNGHDVVDYVSKDDDDTCFCESHPKNECSAYCKTCNVSICMLCVSIKHKSHEMSELSDKIEELLKVIAKENERLQSFKHELESILDHTTKMVSSISSIYKQKKDEVTARGEEWHKEIEKTVKKLHQELDDMQKEHEALLKKQETEYKGILKNLDQINRRATSLQKSNDVKEMQTFIPMIEKQKTLSEFTQYSFPTFCEGKIDADYLQSYFGYVINKQVQENKISFTKKKLKVNEFTETKFFEIPTVISVLDTGFPAYGISNRLFDIAYTDDNKVWMGGNTKELKLFDLQGHLHRTVSITYVGSFIYMLNKQVGYIDENKRAVKIISNSNNDVTIFTTGDWNPRGITSTASGDLLVCLYKDNQSKVVRYSSTGGVLQEIQYDSLCQPIYSSPYYITENVNGDIIVTDWKKNSVIAVNRLGILRFSYSKEKNIFFASAVVHDSFGHVIIADYRGDKIHLLDRDGQFLRYIIPREGIKSPRALCIMGHGEMIVGEGWTGNAKKIKYLK
eukprot:XP_011418717.1 PREDICTED: uncharacterized protein LOC105321926 [Crassostrea gigas]